MSKQQRIPAAAMSGEASSGHDTVQHKAHIVVDGICHSCRDMLAQVHTHCVSGMTPDYGMKNPFHKKSKTPAETQDEGLAIMGNNAKKAVAKEKEPVDVGTMLRSEIAVLLSKIVTQEKEKVQLQTKVNTLSNMLSGRSEERDALKEETGALKTKLQSSYQDYLGLHQTIQDLRTQTELGTSMLKAQNKDLAQRLDIVTEKSSRESETLSQIRERLTEAEATRESLKVQHSALTEKCIDMTEQIKKITNERDKLKVQVSHLNTKAQNDQAKIDHLKLQHNLKDEKIQEWKTKCENVNVRETKEYERLVKQYAELEGTLDTTRIERDDWSKKVDILQKHKETLEQALVTTRSSSSKNANEFESTIKILNEQIEALQKDLEKGEQSREVLLFQITDLRTTLDKESRKTALYEQEAKSLRKQLSTIENQYKAQMNQTTGRASRLEADRRKLTDIIQTAKREIVEKEEQMKILSSKFQAFAEQQHQVMLKLSGKMDDLNEHKSELQQRIVRLQEELVMRKAMIQDLQHELGIGQRTIEKLRMEMTELEMKLKVMTQDYKESVQKGIALSDRLQDSEEECRRITQASREKEDHLSGRIADLDALVEQLKETIVSLRSSLANSQNDIDNLESCKARLEGEVASLERRNEKLDSELSETWITRTQLEVIVDDLQRKLQTEHDIQHSLRRTIEETDKINEHHLLRYQGVKERAARQAMGYKYLNSILEEEIVQLRKFVRSSSAYAGSRGRSATADGSGNSLAAEGGMVM